MYLRQVDIRQAGRGRQADRQAGLVTACDKRAAGSARHHTVKVSKKSTVRHTVSIVG